MQVPQSAIEALLASYEARNFEQAEQLARSLTQISPGHTLAWKVLGGILKLTSRPEAALAAMQQAVRLDVNDAEAHNNLGVILKELGRLPEAMTCYEQAIEINPTFAEAHNNLGNALLAQGKFQEALVCFEAAIQHKPTIAEAHFNLGYAHQYLGCLTAAEAAYRSAVQIRPHYVDALINLGTIFKDRGQLSDAEAMYRKALDLMPDSARALNNLGSALKDLGAMPEAMDSYREAIRVNPSDTKAYSNFLFSLNYLESMPPEAALSEAQRYGALVSKKALPKFRTWQKNAPPHRLRVGFVSGDLRNHPVGYFIEGLIQHLDQAQFELFAFPTNHKDDVLTQRIRPYFQGWVPISSKTDLDAAQAIHENGIQILIDLSGHSAHNRLPVFSFKPAPVQASWLGYFATTGLPEMDFFIGDPHMSPKSEEGHFTEQVWRLADSWLCMTPPNDATPILPLPALNNGYVTFGCFGNLTKMNDAVIQLWSRTLKQVPSSKLFLKAKQLGEDRVFRGVVSKFSNQGIKADRLILEGPTSRKAYFEAYNRIDIVLDSFPYPGGTTSVDALWMGVPVLTLKGDSFLSHLGESIALNSGQSDWIALNGDDFVKKAVTFASDLQALATLRLRLRNQLRQSALMDSKRFAKNFGRALHGMWAWHQENTWHLSQ